MRGRPKKPPELEKAQGFPGRRKGKEQAAIEAQAALPPIAPGDTPQPPSDLDAVAAAKWQELCDVLTRMMVLKQTDFDTLHMYCSAWSDWMYIRRKLKRQFVRRTKSAHVEMERRNPLALELEKKRRELSELQRDLGLTPGTRLAMQSRLAEVTKPQKGRYAARPAATSDTANGNQPGKPPSPIGILKSSSQRPN